ncbi:hypothetical protein [Kitasatospora sp. A2-31]|uniref:hypothetical protein n=1 Tax=Kitasatospora sp. A2-31 TaxID=2916414 RepID=UPI001EEF4959|nr:hypothetical protein [Kitasatospora sp. A2-31]MCG6499275.1 hypothetical protein [Kitasatospora sp. A2-31]
MGLSVSVGFLHDQIRNDPEGYEYHRDAFARLGRALEAEGIAWREPEVTDPPPAAAFSGGFPYGYLTQLRRILVLTILGEAVRPAAAVGGDEFLRDCEKIDDETSMLSSHLLCHADNAGYYVPVDFVDPLFLPAQAQVAGAGMVGSSQRLLAELASIAPSIGIDPEAAAEPCEDPAGTPFESERFAWRQLHQACVASIAEGHAVVFH